jgi:hypothetical protein
MLVVVDELAQSLDESVKRVIFFLCQKDKDWLENSFTILKAESQRL